MAGAPTTRSSPASLPKLDGNRDPEPQHDMGTGTLEVHRGMDDTIGLEGWYASRGLRLPDYIPKRPEKLNTLGKENLIGLNTFDVLKFPDDPVFQYDVTIGNGVEKRGLIKSVWHSKTMQAKLGPGWLFDGNKIAWSLVGSPKKNGETFCNIMIDMDAEKGVTPNESRSGKNTHRVFIRQTKVVRFDLLRAYLANKARHSNEITESIIFLDHLMREWPSQRLTQIKKSFFKHGESRVMLGGGIEAFKGVFSSIRLVANAAGKPTLSVNVDVANGTFFTATDLSSTIPQILNSQAQDFIYHFDKLIADNKWENSNMKNGLKRLAKVGVYVKHRGSGTKEDPHPTYVIDKVLPKNPKQHKFEVTTTDDAGKVLNREWITVHEYFWRKYHYHCAAGFPLVKMTKKDVILPVDICQVVENQRYPFKLNEKQTASMIRFAVTVPKIRWQAVEHGLEMLDWANDRYLRNYHFQINPKQTMVKARVLPAPIVQFGGTGSNSQINSVTASGGRWQLVGKKFMARNSVPLKCWGVCVLRGGRDDADLASCKRFFKQFMEVYAKHGGDIPQRESVIVPGNQKDGDNMVTLVWNATGNKYQMKPQILFFVLPDRNSATYTTIKRVCENRYGVVSQCVQSAQVNKCQDQYISNVCMKVNAKLGGYTSEARGILSKISPGTQKIPTMCIGADVSHPAPGMDKTTGSFAAITMSLNQSLTRYAAAVDTNGHRVEMVSTPNISRLLGKMVNHWMQVLGRGCLPERVLYFRDGVAQEQYAHVVEQEVRDIKNLFRVINPKNISKFIVIVASKRHHVRFFPERPGGDKNGNPLPGTLVETGVTHPFQFDFYLSAHSAIKGTARPVHYHVLMNEPNMPAAELQQMIFEHSFQYVRSTTPVSIFPAVYYAHIASQRAKCHVAPPPKAGEGKKEEKKEKTVLKEKTLTKKYTETSDKTPMQIAQLQRINPGDLGIDMGMWYV